MAREGWGFKDGCRLGGTKSGLLSRWLERNVVVLIVLDKLDSADVDSILIGVRKTSLLGSLDMA